MNLGRILSVAVVALFFNLIVVSSGSANVKQGKSSAVVQPNPKLAERNLKRAMAIVDTAVAHYFVGEEMAMARFYNPFTKELSQERAVYGCIPAPLSLLTLFYIPYRRRTSMEIQLYMTTISLDM